MDHGLNISVLVAARDEYIEQLKAILIPMILQGFNSIYQDAVKISEGKRILWTFQKLLKDVITWNQTILQEESRRIKKKCPYIMDIVTAIFVSNVKILASIRLKGNSDNIKVKIPSSELFIHSIYIETAQQIFCNPYLFYDRNCSYTDIQRNRHEIRDIIYDGIEETVRQMMPFESILEEYLKNALEDNAEYASSDEEEILPQIPNNFENNLNIGNIIEAEPEEEPEEEHTDEIKNLTIGGIPEKFGNLFNSETTQSEEQPMVQPPPRPPMGENSNQFGQNGGDDYSDDSGYESSDSSKSSGSSGSSGSSDSSGSSRSSDSSGSSDSSDSSKSSKSSHRKKSKHKHRHGEKKGKKGYSFF